MYNDYLLISDADGTLLTDDKLILDDDIKAIRRFTDGGGLFALATGRGVMLTRPLAEELALKLPAVVFNGAAIYDFSKECFLWQCTLPRHAHAYAKVFKERFPTVATEILINSDVYVTSTNTREEDHINYGGGVPVRCSPCDVPDTDWIKILLVDEPETIDEIIAYASEVGLTDVYTVRSSPYYFEILPFGVNKGGGLVKLTELCGIKERTTIAVGDFMNDIEMLKAADYAVAVANAEEDVIKTAHYISKDNNSGAVSDIISRIDSGGFPIVSGKL